jgi:hypothetical protein
MVGEPRAALLAVLRGDPTKMAALESSDQTALRAAVAKFTLVVTSLLDELGDLVDGELRAGELVALLRSLEGPR